MTSGAHRRSVTSTTATEASRTRWRARPRSCSRRIRSVRSSRRSRRVRGRCSATIPTRSYYTAPVRDDMTYRVTGNLAGAVYLSFTVELGSEDGGYSTQTVGALRDADFDVAADGSFEIFFGGPERAAKLARVLPEALVRADRALLLRGGGTAAADPNRHVPLTIDPIDTAEPVGPPIRGTTHRSWRWRIGARSPSSATGRSNSRNLANESSHRGCRAPRTNSRSPSSRVTSPSPCSTPAYSMAPYALPDEALVITGRWPECRFANVSLWNRYLQTYDRTEGIDRGSDDGGTVDRDVVCICNGFTSGGSDLLDDRVGHRARARGAVAVAAVVVHDHTSTLGGEQQRVRAPQPSACSGHHRDLTVEPSHVYPRAVHRRPHVRWVRSLRPR